MWAGEKADKIWGTLRQAARDKPLSPWALKGRGPATAETAGPAGRVYPRLSSLSTLPALVCLSLFFCWFLLLSGQKQRSANSQQEPGRYGPQGQPLAEREACGVDGMVERTGSKE